MLPGARKRFYPGCPRKHFDDALLAWFDSYIWLERFGKTPIELGLLTQDELDPKWSEAMLVIAREMDRKKPVKAN